MRVYSRGKRGTWWVDLTIDGERIKRSSGTTDRRQAEEWGANLARDLWRTKRLGEAPRVPTTTRITIRSQGQAHSKVKDLHAFKRRKTG